MLKYQAGEEPGFTDIEVLEVAGMWIDTTGICSANNDALLARCALFFQGPLSWSAPAGSYFCPSNIDWLGHKEEDNLAKDVGILLAGLQFRDLDRSTSPATLSPARGPRL